MSQVSVEIVSACVSTAGVFVTAGGLFLVYRQVRANANIARADFVLRLENAYLEHHTETYKRYCNRPPDLLVNADEIAAVEDYLDFFATLQILRDDHLLSMETIDRMFAYRFFVVADNEQVAAHIQKNQEFWSELIRLTAD